MPAAPRACEVGHTTHPFSVRCVTLGARRSDEARSARRGSSANGQATPVGMERKAIPGLCTGSISLSRQGGGFGAAR
ncbi:hypothetical protein JMJ77_0013525 [Colletotrichum scovillei]|uniref:Uncharacterized protein n=1 Tax=Colletotrichum scovillei TaxID=1209932 RepID=A0A9P7R5V9_9PEZI|nr:hypothetical protein JMJ77_0013525 [Colletotrichum scovillei]KAG7069829.1 hypothetical protein JMJ76_0003489 [Colletotrichum scovillei]KAG7073739.1 hypothetical protein JMJ78_0014706 [Colletotrichum scovillei]